MQLAFASLGCFSNSTVTVGEMTYFSALASRRRICMESKVDNTNVEQPSYSVIGHNYGQVRARERQESCTSIFAAWCVRGMTPSLWYDSRICKIGSANLPSYIPQESRVTMVETTLVKEEVVEVLTHAPPVTPSAVRPWHQNFAPPKEPIQFLTS